ncbi:MAG: class I SAM-dependent methyltransferase [Syntrophomonadaceae bacterium]
MSWPAEAPPKPAARRVAERFAHLRGPGSGLFFDALSEHFAHLETHPVLPLHFEYAATANERGERAAGRLGKCLPQLHRRGLFSRRPRVLDVGCAYGGFLVAFARRGARVTGIDVDPRYVRLAALNLREQGLDGELVHGDAGEPHPEFAGLFDLVIANDVLEHVPRPAAFLTNLRAWLAPSGAAYLEIPNGAWPPYVARDGHHQLFGLTLLSFAEASEYLRLLSPGARYDTYHYLSPEECERLFAEAALTFELLPDPLEGVAVETVLGEAARLRAAAPDGLVTVPGPLREKVRDRLEGYLDHLDSAPRATPGEIGRFLLRYGAPFWIVIARPK